MRHLHALIIATGLCVPSLALAAAPASQMQRPVSSQVTTSQHAAPTVTSESRPEAAQADRARYAEKDAKSGEAKDYRGGDTVVIGASAATAILAVILLLVLI
jgi:hypothetical protein